MRRERQVLHAYKSRCPFHAVHTRVAVGAAPRHTRMSQVRDLQAYQVRPRGSEGHSSGKAAPSIGFTFRPHRLVV